MAADLLTELRSATRSAHERLEQRLDVAARCAELASYTDMLAGMHSVYAPLERSLAECPATATVVPDWAARRKSEWLRQDLDALGAELLPAAATPPVATTEDVLGVMYVLEGATLGAAVIVRQLQMLPAAPSHRFFMGYGEGRVPMWRAFRRHVGEVDPETVRVAKAVLAARRTFAAVERACTAGDR